ncbi:hypothetical protein I4U23_027308 [Adineta vaga]|nr:hypothetical protein I4U23_027308 [Adineta vaga]
MTKKIDLSKDIVQNFLVTSASQAMQHLSSLALPVNEQSISQKAQGDRSSAFKNGTDTVSKTPIEVQQAIYSQPESHPEYAREVLNVYGKFIFVHKRGSLFFLVTLTKISIFGALIAVFNSLFLATSSVYRDGPCPSIGPMDCFCGGNHTYFSCDTGKTAAFPYDVHSGACFRWIGRDITTSDVTTQLGVTAGILVAFGSIAQAIIRIYLLAFNKRLSIATGIHRTAAKTIGINRDTAQTRFCCCNLPWHCSACSVILLYYYELNVTSLTFVVLIVIAVLCLLSIGWVMVEESEASSNIPGEWVDAKALLQKISDNATGITKTKISPINKLPLDRN